MGAVGGSLSSSASLVTANLPPYTPSGSIANGSISASLNATVVINGTGSGIGGGGSFGLPIGTTISVSQAASAFTGAPQGGTSAPIVRSTLSPTIVVNYIIKR